MGALRRGRRLNVVGAKLVAAEVLLSCLAARARSEYLKIVSGGEVLTVGFIRQVAIRALSSRVPPKATPMEGVVAC